MPINSARHDFMAGILFTEKIVKKWNSLMLGGLLSLSCLNALAETPSEPTFEKVARRAYDELLQRTEKAIHDKQAAESADLAKRLACGGNQIYQGVLGSFYLSGQGVSRDDITGYAWLKLAAASGVPQYLQLTKALEDGMTAEQRPLADAKVTKLKSLLRPESNAHVLLPEGSQRFSSQGTAMLTGGCGQRWELDLAQAMRAGVAESGLHSEED